jgi:choice-of-anchor B domain-containing protein
VPARSIIAATLLAALLAGAAVAHGPFPCVGGNAGGHACNRVDLAHHLDLSAIGGGSGSDIWGWTDPLTQREYALMGRSNGTAFVDVTDPEAPIYLGNLPTRANPSAWRDIKVWSNHAYVVSDNNSGQSGLQIFDLTLLRTVVNPPVTFTATAVHDGFDDAHNIAINEQTGFAYVVGSNTCSGGLRMLDLSNPTAPSLAGCFSADGYTHDVQCVVYNGPDLNHVGKEICFAANEDTVTIVDVTNKAAPVQISRTVYSGRGYTHQGWLTDDHRYFLLDDETDELNDGGNTRTRVWDVEDLDSPTVDFTYTGPVPAIDHNLYVRGRYAYLANYTSGLRILDLAAIESNTITEAAFFDTYMPNNSASFNGAWSSYPYFASGTVIVSDINSGLFVLRPQLCDPLTPPDTPAAEPGSANQIELSWGALVPGETVDVERAYGGCGAPDRFETLVTGLTGATFVDTNVSGQVPVAYRLVRRSTGGACRSDASACVEATTTGACTAPPAFGGLVSATSGSATCAVDLTWAAATPRCAGPTRYDVHRANAAEFAPSPATRIASNLDQTTYRDYAVLPGSEWSWLVRSRDLGNGAEDPNLITQTVIVDGPLTDGSWASGAEIGDPVLSGGQVQAEKHAGWHIHQAFAHSGDRSWSSESFAATCLAITSSPITLTPGEASTLELWSAWNQELDGKGLARDGGVVEISTDDGVTWSPISPKGGYPATFGASANVCGYEPGQGTFSGEALDSWSQWVFDLSPYNAGPPIRLRFLASTDLETTLDGWFLDDLTVTHAQVAGSCTPAIFIDGFESGDVGAWSAAVP